MKWLKLIKSNFFDRTVLAAILIALPDEFDSFKRKWNSTADKILVNKGYSICYNYSEVHSSYE
jgi:hypothetical protein